jgi:SRSO17 transposase
MPKITRFPAFCKRFFRRLRKLFGSGNGEHFWRLVLALASMPGRRSLRRLTRVLKDRRTRQALAYFLNQAHWQAPDVLRQAALETLKRLRYRPGDTIAVVLDDTQKRKRGRVMAAVSKLFLHAERVYAHGHTIVGCALVFRGVIIPYAVAVWASQACCAQTQSEPDAADRLAFRKLTQLAADLLTSVTLPEGTRGLVLFDAYYLCAPVTAACQAAHWPFVSVAKKNRNFAPDGRPRDRRKVGKYGCRVLQREGHEQTVEGKKHRLAQRVGWLSKVGRVKLVFSRRPGEKVWVALVTNATRWGAATVLRNYFQRWPIEVLFKMSKQYLGLGDYQVLRYRGVVRYLHLVLIAYLLLTYLAVSEPGIQAKVKGTDKLRLPSIPQLQAQLRQSLWTDVITNMEKSSRHRRAAQKLKELIVVE